MGRRVWFSWLVVLLMSLSCFGCGGAEWHKIDIETPYQIPKRLTISVGSPPALREAAQSLASALADELNGRGIAAVILPPASGAAEVNVEVYQWNSLPADSYWTRPGTARGVITVVVDTATLGVQGMVSGWRNAGGTMNDAASSAGHLIGRTLATGREDGRPAVPPGTHG